MTACDPKRAFIKTGISCKWTDRALSSRYQQPSTASKYDEERHRQRRQRLFAVTSGTFFDRRSPVSFEDLPVQASRLGHRLHVQLAGENAPT